MQLQIGVFYLPWPGLWSIPVLIQGSKRKAIQLLAAVIPKANV